MNRQKDIRVLIAEDDYLVSEMIKGLLEEKGYPVVGEATNGLEAVEMTQSLQPDVVLMDIRMPDVDGIQATQLIHERCPTPVVALTAYEELVESASEAGVSAYLVKPPNATEIERAIIVAMSRFKDVMELRRLNRELEARNRELDAFAHTVAHGLRDPLTLMIGYADILRATYGADSDENLQECLRPIVQNVHRMSNIIDELLLLAQVRKLEVRPSRLDMAVIVSEASRRLAYLIEEYEPEIVLPDTWPEALGYAPWIEEVWVNYLSNAVRYGGHPPRVELGADLQEDGQVRFWVRDNGLGLTPEEQVRLFLPFTHLDQVRTRGHGLGLSIVRRIVEKLGGHVEVESEPDRGSVFSFTLPGVASRAKTSLPPRHGRRPGGRPRSPRRAPS